MWFWGNNGVCFRGKGILWKNFINILFRYVFFLEVGNIKENWFFY